MATVVDVIRKMQEAKKGVKEETRRALLRSQYIIDLKLHEFEQGKTPQGDRIGFYRNRGYSLFKRSLNPLASGTVDLRLTGSFYRGTYLDEQNGKFLFDSHDDKAPELFAKYGDENRGLNDTDWITAQNYILPEVVEYINRILRTA